MLEPHLAKIKHQEESKLRHLEPLARGKLLYATLHRENRRAPTLPDTGSKPAWETFREQQVSTKYHTVFPQSPLG
jgi:hypothetical protein